MRRHTFCKCFALIFYKCITLLIKLQLLLIIKVKGGFIMKEKKELNIRIGERIRQARENAEYTQEKLAEKVDVSTQYISDLERGIVGTSIQTLIKICHALSVSSDFILMGHITNVKPLDISVRLQALSPKERKIMEATINLMIEAFHVNHNTNCSKTSEQKKE